MGLLPMDADILPPSDDRVFKLILTMEDAKPVLIDLISAILGRGVIDVEIRNNDMPAGDVDEKAERLDINCKLDGHAGITGNAGEPDRRAYQKAA